MIRLTIALLCIAIVWEFLPELLDVPTFSFPRLSAVLARIAESWDVFAVNLRVSVLAICLSLVIAILIGTLLALASHVWPLVRAMTEPLILISQLIPRIALVPLVLIWFGWGIKSKIIIAVLIAFFPIYEGLRSGLFLANRDLILQARLLGYSRVWQLFCIECLLAAPQFFVGLKTAALFVVFGVVVAEFLASGDGVGIRIIEAMGRGDTPAAFGYILLISASGMVLYFLLEVLERITLKRLRLVRA